MSTVIVSGPLANKPLNGGIAWVPLSYVFGFRQLGLDVHFIEEIAPTACTGMDGRSSTFDQSINLAFFRSVVERFDLPATLVYNRGARTIGKSLSELRAFVRSADFLLNISGHLATPELKNGPRRLAYLDLDPGYTQLWHASGDRGPRLEGHDAYFTVGENVGARVCPIPTNGIGWRATRPPFVRGHWPVASQPDHTGFTTVASWRGGFGPVEFEGRTYGLKAHEFRRFLQLPSRLPTTFEIALDIHVADEPDRIALLEHGWQVVPPREVCPDPEAFRRYVHGSGAEFSVAQGIYVETTSGWFSDRTVRYLASGRPALVQDTGLALNYPTGEGLVTFSTLEQAVAGAADILEEYERHSTAARALAEECFDSDRVLARLLDEAGVSP
jgi:hypothetical protein